VPVPPRSLALQQEVEKYYIEQGLLFPFWHRYYWMGLQSNRKSYPKFSWSDPLTPSLETSGAYKHWGLYMPGNFYEPYAANPPEYCAGGNFTQIYQAAAGWADTSCDDIHIYICQIRRE
jgi:hypothetical protein